MPHQRQGADELRAALIVRHVAQDLEQLGIVGRVAAATGVARRVDARRPAQGVHRQAGVVGQRRQAAHTRRVAGLEDGVLDERQAGFLRLDRGELADRAHAHVGAEHGLQFLEFAGIVAGQHQFAEEAHRSGKNSWLKVKLLRGPPALCTLMVKLRVSLPMGNCAR